MLLRIARPTDAEAIRFITDASDRHHFADVYETATLASVLPIMTNASPALLESGRFFLVETSSGEPVGCGGWSEERPGTRETAGETGHLRHFAVMPEAGGKGIGRQIFQACREQARDAGLTKWEVLASLNARGFYAKLGFTEIGPKTAIIAGKLPLPAIEMHRAI